MVEAKGAVKLFEGNQVRTVWDEDAEKWWFSIVDIVAVLIDNDHQSARNYWKVLKNRMVAEGNQTVTNCNRLKLPAPDGRQRLTDVADAELVLRLVQSIPSKKAEPFKTWLARVGSERMDEAVNLELSIDRAIKGYRRLGYSEDWINQRIQSIEVRKALTDEWDKSGVRDMEYAKPTDLMTMTWSGFTTKEYKKHKGLKKEGLRDNMTNLEPVLNMLAEASATDISAKECPLGFLESAGVAVRGAETARAARKQHELSTGESAISPMNAKQIAAGKTKKTLN